MYEHLQRAGVTPARYAGFQEDEMATARELYESGLSLAAVGERLGADASTIRRYLAEAGVPIRPRRGWPLASPVST